ncbi:MAG TPA: cytochrome c [Candidatus Eisenbacteria bacterium]|nr:cytochrome c [Candidatus Eisenbacteria bacterium]
MLRKAIFAVGAMLMAAGLCLAQQSTGAKPEIKKEPIKQISPASGKEMFTQYCAPCHGTDGKGNGPAAPALKAQPTDLTQLAKNNGGKYPSAMVSATLRFGSGPASHGSADMPVWGPLFKSLDKFHDSSLQQRISNLVSYIETLQVR